MSKYILTKKDYEQIETLIKMSNSIFSVYYRLYQLEEKHKNNVYYEYLSCLNIALDKEEKLYLKMDLMKEKASAYKDYLISTFHVTNSINELINPKKEDRIINRIISKLDSIILANKNIDNELINGIFSFMESLKIINVDSVSIDAMKNINTLDQYFEGDILNLFLLILEEYRNDKKYKNYKEELLKIKYMLSFVNDSVEKSIVQDSFHIQPIIYLSSKLYSDYFKINPEAFELLKNVYGLDQSYIQMSKLLELYDIDYNDSTILIDSICNQSLLRSAVSFLYDDTFSHVKNQFKNALNHSNYVKDHQNDKISKAIIRECFKHNKKDKEKSSEVSLILTLK